MIYSSTNGEKIMSRYLVLKDSIPVATANSSEEADELYLLYDGSEIQEIDDGN